MQYIRLTRAGVSVSRIGLGCEQLGGTDWGQYDLNETIRSAQLAVELGINLFDTANVYGLGQSERVLSEVLGARKHDMVIVTKGGVRWELPPSAVRASTYVDLSRKNLRESVEGSLKRLGLDVIPLYLLHWPDRTLPLEEPLETLVQLKSEGKIRAIGLSNFSFPDVRKADELIQIAAVQFRYNLLDQSCAQEMFPYCAERGIGVLVYGSLAEGLLAGKYAEQSVFPAGDRRSRLKHFHGDVLKRNLQIVERVKQVAQAHGRTLAQIAVSWVLSNKAVSAAVVGMKNVAQLEDVVGSVGWHLDDADVHKLSGMAADE